MTFNPNSDIGGGRVSRRGRNTGIAAGGVGLGAVVVFVIAQLLGVNLGDLSGSGGGTTSVGQSQSGAADSVTECQTGADANANVTCRMKGAAASLDTYWGDEVPKLGATYSTPQFVLFTDTTGTGCGTASSSTGPFYCPPDTTLYVDTGFFDQLRNQFGATGGPLAEMYVVAHEWGHHIQNLLGTMNTIDPRATGPTSDSVRLELQADCYAGAWVGAASTVKDENGVTFLEPVTQQQVADALNAAAAVGDDRIQQAATGAVDKESWTHGSSAERQRWFSTGMSGGPTACDTFAVPSSRL